MLRNSIVIDLEWDITTGKPFLLGYAYNLSSYYYLAQDKINTKNIKKILEDKDIKKIFVFGPDAGIIEKKYLPNLKKDYQVFNVLTAVRKTLTRYKKHSLQHLERYFLKIKRKNNLKDFRESLLQLFENDPDEVINYNKEDVLNTIRIINKLNRDYKVNWEDFRL